MLPPSPGASTVAHRRHSASRSSSSPSATAATTGGQERARPSASVRPARPMPSSTTSRGPLPGQGRLRRRRRPPRQLLNLGLHQDHELEPAVPVDRASAEKVGEARPGRPRRLTGRSEALPLLRWSSTARNVEPESRLMMATLGFASFLRLLFEPAGRVTRGARDACASADDGHELPDHVSP
jgi:hypothetical protein